MLALDIVAADVVIVVVVIVVFTAIVVTSSKNATASVNYNEPILMEMVPEERS